MITNKTKYYFIMPARSVNFQEFLFRRKGQWASVYSRSFPKRPLLSYARFTCDIYDKIFLLRSSAAAMITVLPLSECRGAQGIDRLVTLGYIVKHLRKSTQVINKEHESYDKGKKLSKCLNSGHFR